MMTPTPPMLTTAMVLAAGFGTRLRPLTQLLPKPLIPLGDRSVLAHIVERLASAGVARVVVNRHHLRDRFIDPCVCTLPLPIALSDEDTILGTAGGVRQAAPWLGSGDVLVVNGDILADVDYAHLLAVHRHADAAATLAVQGGLPRGEGSVGLAADGTVVRLRDGRYGQEVAGGWFVGVQIIGERVRRQLPLKGCLVGDVYMPMCARGERVLAAPVVGAFRDIGTPAAYLDACMQWLEGRPHHCADDAQVEALVTLDKVVVGAGAQVLGSGALRRVVVWPGATATAPLRDAIVLPGRPPVLLPRCP